jgi:putative hemolysin
MPTETWLPITAGALLVCGAILSTVCYSLRNFTRSRLAAVCKSHGNVERLGEVLRQDETVLAVSEILTASSIVAGTALLAVWRYPDAAQASGWRPLLDLFLIAAAAGFGVMILPWSLSRVYGERIVYRTWPLVSGMTTVCRPLLLIAWRVDTILHRIAGRSDPEPETVETLTDEIQSVVDEGEREGVLETRAGRMIQRIMELREYDVRAAMTPRTDVVFVPQTASWEEARDIILESGHSRLPVVGESADDVLGILYARDMLQHAGPQAGRPSLSELLRPANYVPETTTIEDLLERMKRERFHIAIVLDEYGGLSGLVTLEDILEEIVGDIADEFDEAEEDQVRRVDDDTIDVDARTHIDDLNEEFDFGLPDEEDYDTIGGFVFSEFGRIPAQGESFTWRNLRFTVLEADQRKVIKLRIEVDRSLVPAHDGEA